MNAGEPLLSPDWYRVAFMRPRLRPGVAVTRQRVRGQTWYVMSDPVSGRHHRVNDVAYGLIACCDGGRTLDDIWAARVDTLGDDAPTQGEAIRVVIEAFRANLFVGDVAPDATGVVNAHLRDQHRRRRAAINPLAFRLPLWDPDAALAGWAVRLGWLFHAPAQRIVWAVIGLGALLFLMQGGAVLALADGRIATGRMLFILWLVYPLIKGLHELAHALAVKSLGGQVHEIGITLLMLTPVPYVDASASVAFADKRDRMTVAAAGIATEALLAVVALVAWLLLEPGLARDVAFAVVFIGGVSTVLVNGNPLLRFDGYFILCDALELPNLAGRSIRYWQDLLKRTLRLRLVSARQWAPGERCWLLAYAPLAWLCRTALLVALAAWVAGHSAVLGMLLLLAAGWLAIGKPMWATLTWAFGADELNGQRSRALAAVVAGVAAVSVLTLEVPLPRRSHAPAVVWLPDDALARAGTEGFLAELLVADGAQVEAGAAIARLVNEPLRTEFEVIERKLAVQEVKRATSFGEDAKAAAIANDELERLRAERDGLRSRIGQLTLRAGAPGRVAIDTRRVIPGQFVAQGELLAQVLPAGAPLVRALVSNEDVAAVRELLGERPEAVRVTLAHDGGAAQAAIFERAVPQGTVALPSAALGDHAGGSISLNPDDTSGRTAREPRFQFDLRLGAGVDARIGARALVTFVHEDACLATLLGDFARRSFLRHFEK